MNEITTRALWTGRVLSGLAVLFLTFDAAIKLLRLPVAVEGTTQLGYLPDVVQPIGLLQVVCLVTYLVPRTSVLGAVLWTGYLGGDCDERPSRQSAVQPRAVPVYVALLLRGGLWLRHRRLRGLLPLA